jgi:negative regulator of flagellin synthesis FlgM
MKVTNNPTPNPYQTETSVEQARNSQRAGKAASVDSMISQAESHSSSGANVEISDGAKLMRQAADIAKASPESHPDKIRALKKSIQDGTYQVDARAIADRLVDEHLNADFGKNSL